MLVGGLALSIGIAIYDLTVRELDLSQTATQSQFAIYAADTGAECALYWDFKCPLGTCTTNGAAGSAFATSSQMAYPGSGIMCNGLDVRAQSTWAVVAPIGESAATTTFTITFSPQPYCAVVTVAKYGTPTKTSVTSKGYNFGSATCGSTVGMVRLERALRVSY